MSKIIETDSQDCIQILEICSPITQSLHHPKKFIIRYRSQECIFPGNILFWGCKIQDNTKQDKCNRRTHQRRSSTNNQSDSLSMLPLPFVTTPKHTPVVIAKQCKLIIKLTDHFPIVLFTLCH